MLLLNISSDHSLRKQKARPAPMASVIWTHDHLARGRPHVIGARRSGAVPRLARPLRLNSPSSCELAARCLRYAWREQGRAVAERGAPESSRHDCLLPQPSSNADVPLMYFRLGARAVVPRIATHFVWLSSSSLPLSTPRTRGDSRLLPQDRFQCR